MNERDVTLIMTTYENLDFTKAALHAFKRFYPKVRTIIADGGSTEQTVDYMLKFLDAELIVGFGKTSEECCNIASALVDTRYVLFMDNDTKVIAPDALPLLVEALEADPMNACTGAYAVIVADWEKHVAFTGTVFDRTMTVDATARYIQLHRTAFFRDAGMFPTNEWFYPDMGKHFDPKAYPQGCQGDMVISRRYQTLGMRTVTPKASVPCLHWGGAKITAQLGERQRAPEDWYYANVKHTRVDPKPLSTWKELL